MADSGARIERCKRPTPWGTCGFPLDDDGTCPCNDHTDNGEEQG